MRYNFDEIIDRRNTSAVKIERCKALYGTEDVLPLWVADMDFRTPDFIFEAIRERCEHPILGYSMPPKEFYPTIINWIEEHHQWEVKRPWIGFIPGIVPGLSFSIQALTNIGDEVIVQPPVYYPFFHVIKNNNRIIIDSPLKTSNGKFEMDFDNLERIITPKTKLFILCNPHNPGGRVWDFETLKRLAEICNMHNIIVVSDEIHADMVLGNNKHIPFATVSESAAQISVTFMAPSKTFNMPGLISSSYIIPNEDIRKQFVDFLEASELNGGNIFAYAATVAAYQKGNEWRKQMLKYVQGNIDFVVNFLETNIPQIKPMIPQASFLVWLNCKELGMETDNLFDFFIQKAGLGLNKGTVFGQGGEYHLRLNVACPRSVLEKAMKQLHLAVNNHQ
ncbi:MAG: PatB family C-S lyase [Paludibacter sp.]|nr:PatB family C-S lyase [Paludibacter sp.]